MDLLMMVLLLMVCLLISNIISHYIPSIPTALTQIALGLIVALVFRNASFQIEAHWFLLLFVAPILYNDGRHFPREELWRMRGGIFGNALILVILTTIGGGYFVHWMIPSIPLAAAFALMAILSPTDPVAVNGIARRIHIPEKVLNLVRGESLINDASGLVAFTYAVTAVVTGYFSLREAIINFAYVFLVGAILGLVLGFLVTFIRFILHKQGINDVVFHSLLQILTPFIVYIITEELLHASGIIAVVVAGIVNSLVRERTETKTAEEHVLTENIWSIILFVLNGIVFLLLGLNIPLSMSETVANPRIGNLQAVAYVIAIGVAILGIRFVWSYFFSKHEYKVAKTKDDVKPSAKLALIISLTGVRGTVTMAGILTIPLILASGEAFPERSLILFLAAGVILFTLIAATVFLPLLSKREAAEGEMKNRNNLSQVKSKLLLDAIKKLELEMNEENESVAYELVSELKSIFRGIRSEEEPAIVASNSYQQKLSNIRLIALKAERKYIYELFEKNEIQEEVFEAFENSLDYREEALSNNVRHGTMFLIMRVVRDWKRFSSQKRSGAENRLGKLWLGKDIQLKALQAALVHLEQYSKEHEGSDIVYAVIMEYKALINRLGRPNERYSEKNEELKEELRIKVMDKERAEISEMYKSGEITKEQVKELRRYINYIESVVLQKPAE